MDQFAAMVATESDAAPSPKRTLTLELNLSWDLRDGGSWDLYRRNPEPAELDAGQQAFGGQARFALRQFELVLLEVLRQAAPPSLDRRFEPQTMPAAFVESSRAMDLRVDSNCLTQRVNERS